jgi:transcriptional regulator GlxA family with amidase domain
MDGMDRRRFLGGGAAAIAVGAAGAVVGAAAAVSRTNPTEAAAPKLEPPATGRIPVAVAISEGVTVIDFAGPWEVFQDVSVPERGDDAGFELFTVSETTAPLRGSAGLRLVPDRTFADAPSPRVIVVPAQRGGEALHEWLRKASRTADVTMSVCTGAFQLAKAGLLKGLDATTHHDFTDRLAASYPDVRVKRGLRFVEGPRISTAGGLTSGIDLALRVVERYFGRPTAERTAAYMEYQSRGWII